MVFTRSRNVRRNGCGYAVSRLRLLLCLCIVLEAAIPLSPAPVKRALIIAIGSFRYVRHISSANDVQPLSAALTAQQFSGIKALTDSAATLRGIRSALHALITETRQGDIVLLHFSTHGQQIFDDNGDEPDGLDEALLCYAAKPIYDASYQGQEHLRDDELGKFADSLRRAAGADGQVVITLDACHSGSGTRGSNIVRGGYPALVPAGFKGAAAAGDAESEIDQPLSGGGLAPLVVFSAARAYQLAHEFQNMGSLTYALVAALGQPVALRTYRTLFGELQATMAQAVRSQDPVAEGNGLDALVFGAGTIPPPPYYTPVRADSVNRAFTINAGTFAGVYVGTGVYVVPAGSLPGKNKRVAEGVVTEANGLLAVVHITSGTALAAPQGWWVYADSLAPPALRISVALRGFSGTGIKNLTDALSGLKNFFLVPGPATEDVLITANAAEASAELRRSADGAVITRTNTLAVSEIVSALTRYAQGELLKNLRAKDSAARVEARFLLVKNFVGFAGTQWRFKDTLPCPVRAGKPCVSKADTVLLLLSNTGSKAAFYNVIDIAPDGAVSLLYPDVRGNQDASSFTLAAGDSFIVPAPLLFGEPYGTEQYKVIATGDALDLRQTFAAMGAERRSKGSGNPLEGYIDDSFFAGTRGARKLSTQTRFGVSDFIFEVTER